MPRAGSCQRKPRLSGGGASYVLSGILRLCLSCTARQGNMGRKKIVKFVVFLALAIVLGAQLGAPMPEESIPYSFEYYDRNANGVLDEEELSIYVLQKCDRSENGYLTKNEWQPMVADLHHIFRGQDVIGDFLYWDVDENRNLDFNELQEMLVQGGIFTLWDKNEDEVIGRSEISGALYTLCDIRNKNTVDRESWEIFVE